MPHNRQRQSRPYKDELLCALEMRETQSKMALEQLELRRQTLETTLQRFKKLYDNSPIGFITFDHSARIIDINHSAVRLLQVTPAAVLGLSMTMLISAKSCPRFMEHLRKARRAGGDPISAELEMIAARGGRIDVRLVTSAVQVGQERIFETALIDLTAQKISEAAISRAREYAESIVSTIPYPVVVVNAKSIVVGANAAFFYLFQTSDTQVVNWPITELPDVTWLLPVWDEVVRKTIAEGRPIEGLVVRAEVRRGSTLTLNVNLRRLNRAGDRLDYLLIAFEDITRRQRAEQERELLLTELQESQARLEVRVNERTRELGKSYSRLRNMGEQLILAHEQEQRRIARELHDQIGQDLTALKLTLSRGKSASPEEALRTLQEAEALTDEMLQTVRNICSTLRPQVLDDLGLVQGLQWHIKTFAARTGMEISFDVQPVDEARLSAIVKSTIFRVIQEALTNVSRHAETKSASVTLAAHNGSVSFSIHDTGKGFDTAEAAKKASTGLSSMRERLSLVQVRFEISSAPGQGTTIRAQIPLPPAEENLDTPSNNANSGINRTEHGKRTSNQSNHRGRSSFGAQGT